MKNIIIFMLLLLSVVGFVGCENKNNNDYLRIHIRANSNNEEDQNVKFFIKDIVVEYMTPLLVDAKNKNDVMLIIEENKRELIHVVDMALQSQGFDYGCSISINNEFFPTRNYDGLTLDADYYDALIVNLGSGDGNNWWCVMYPNLCFNNPNDVVYKSKIKEIIDKIKG